MNKQKKGFALFSPEKLRALASRAGKKAQANGNTHKFNAETGKAAGQKGGKAVVRKRLAENPNYFSDIGRRGGIAAAKKREMES